MLGFIIPTKHFSSSSSTCTTFQYSSIRKGIVELGEQQPLYASFNAEKKKKKKKNTVAQQVFPGYIAAEWWAQIKASLSWQALEDFTLTVSLCQSNSAGAHHQVNACQLKGVLQKQDVLSARNALQKGSAQQELAHCLRSSQQVLWHLQIFQKAETRSKAARKMSYCRFLLAQF